MIPMIRVFTSASLLAVLSIGGLLPATGQGTPAPAISWESDIDAAVRKAVKEGKPLALYFFRASCPHCQRLGAEVLPTKQVQALGPRAVFVRTDLDKKRSQTTTHWMEMLKVTQVPWISVVNVANPQSYVERGRIVGVVPADEFVRQLNSLLSDVEKAIQQSKAPAGKEPLKLPKVEAAAGGPAASGACSLTDEALGQVLTKLGLNPKRIDFPNQECMHRVTFQKDGKQLDVNVGYIKGRGVWLGIPLVQVAPAQAQAPALLKLLEENFNIFPANFAYVKSSEWLYLSTIMDERDVTASDRLRTQLDDLVRMARARENLWAGLGKR